MNDVDLPPSNETGYPDIGPLIQPPLANCGNADCSFSNCSYSFISLFSNASLIASSSSIYLICACACSCVILPPVTCPFSRVALVFVPVSSSSSTGFSNSLAGSPPPPPVINLPNPKPPSTAINPLNKLPTPSINCVIDFCNLPDFQNFTILLIARGIGNIAKPIMNLANSNIFLYVSGSKTAARVFSPVLIRKPATVEKNLTIPPIPWIRLFIFLTDCGSDIHFIT